MLDRHLIAKTNPIANPGNIVLWGNYRVTVLQDRLFRLEHSPLRRFRDGATQCIWFRNMPKQKFDIYAGEDSLKIITPGCTLIVRKRRRDCRVIIDGEEKRIRNAENLGGTGRTLDCFDGEYFVGYAYDQKIKADMGAGVCSKSGIAVFDDAASLTLSENGEIAPIRGDGTDEYIFAYGHDYENALKALFLITGDTPLLPRYALGNWWSRYHAYTDIEYLRLLNRFEENGIPLTVATIDMDWHYSDHIEEELRLSLTEEEQKKKGTGYRFGWTGYTWNENLFPDYKTFLNRINAKGLKITLNLHPSEGIARWESCYKEMAAAMGIDSATEKTVKFDIADSRFINAYFSVIHKPYEKDGVEFWWIDWQQGTSSSVSGLDPLWALNHYHFFDAAANHTAPLILSRYAGLGSHRYPIGFSGDTVISWQTLSFLPYFTATASNIGYCWWSHDIGGHMGGTTDPELYTRFLQYGVFSPINRLHSSNDETVTKEPWAYGNGTGLIAAEFLRLRHRLIPYLNTANHRLHTEGIPPIRPLYYLYPEEEAAYRYRNEYFFGSELLVIPVTQKMKKDGFARVKAWIPEGAWTDIFTGDRYEVPAGGRECILYRTLDSIPVLAREGAILPLSSLKDDRNLQIDIFSGKGKFRLIEEGYTAEIAVDREEYGAAVKLKITRDVPSLILRFPDITEGEALLFENGEKIACGDCSAGAPSYTFAAKANADYELQIRFRQKSETERLIERAQKILLRAQEDNALKWKTWGKLKSVNSKEEYLFEVENSGLRTITRLRLKETI